MKIVVIALILFLIAGGAYGAARYFAFYPRAVSPFTQVVSQVTQSGETQVSWKVEEFARGLEVPWSVVFVTPERVLVTERPGRIRIIENGQLLPQPLHEFSEVSTGSEEGLMGLVADPNYSENRYVYASLAYPKNDGLAVKIVRFSDLDNLAQDMTTILDNIPAAKYHAGTRLRFGPDDKLYVSTGDATDKEIAQDLNSLGGKMLRMNSDGSIPSDNPFPNSLVYSYGHRNSQGFDWHPVTGDLFQTEHGPSLFDGPAGGDEVNLIQAGQNYGWPLVSHERRREGTVAPLLLYTPAEAPASGTFYNSDVIPQFTHNFFFGALRGEGLIRVILDSTDPTQVQSQEKFFDQEYGRIREVTVGPDGALYFSTSNRDGRGDPQEGDDKIYRIVRDQ